MTKKVWYSIGGIGIMALIAVGFVMRSLYLSPSPTNQILPVVEQSVNINPQIGIVAGAETSNEVANVNVSDENGPAISASPSLLHTSVMATIFWVGETPTSSNAYIPNMASAWDSHWQDHYGGVDRGTDRCGFQPCAFGSKENPFYIALPYNDLNPQGHRKPSAANIPWFESVKQQTSVLKNHWVAVTFAKTTCYGQVEDVGPYEHDDFDYVFGTAHQKNQFGQKAGIDISPAVRDCLGMKDNELVDWQFVDDQAVPPGPWTTLTTTSDAQWLP